MRYFIELSYNGKSFHGWQNQPNATTVQSVVEDALSKLLCNDISITGAGRTDTGVNGCYQVVHFDTPNQRIDRAWVMGTNRHLPDDIAVLWAKPVSDQFHARFSAQARRYRYLIYSAPVKPAILSRGVTWTHKSLDIARMQSASRCLIGEHDFSSYRAVACQANSPIRTVHDLQVYKRGEIIVLDIQANAFLHHMVRNIAGVLMKIGAGEAEVEWAADVLEARDRRKGGVTAPPWGLYFCDVEYPEEFALPRGGKGPYFLGD